MRLRPFAAALAVLALCGFHKGNHFTVDFPSGWSAPATDDKGIVTTKSPDGFTNCNAQANILPGLANFTNEQINQEFAKVLSVDDWANLLAIDASNLTISEGELRPVGDTYFHIATLVIAGAAYKTPTDIKTRFGVYILPGRMVMAGCYASASNFDGYRLLFEKTVSSLHPE